MTKVIVYGVVLVCLIGGGVVWASTSRAQALAYTCMTCHGPNGRSRAEIPSIDTLSYVKFKEALLAFRAGTRKATIMGRIAKAYSDEQIDLLARYFSTVRTQQGNP